MAACSRSAPRRILYERPANPFVAGFIGRSTMIPGILRGDRFDAEGATLHLASAYGTGTGTLALRPERLSLARRVRTDPVPYPAPSRSPAISAPSAKYLVQVAPGLDLIVRRRHRPGRRAARVGTAVTIRWDGEAERAFGRRRHPLPSALTPTRIATHA